MEKQQYQYNTSPTALSCNTIRQLLSILALYSTIIVQGISFLFDIYVELTWQSGASVCVCLSKSDKFKLFQNLKQKTYHSFFHFTPKKLGKSNFLINNKLNNNPSQSIGNVNLVLLILVVFSQLLPSQVLNINGLQYSKEENTAKQAYK